MLVKLKDIKDIIEKPIAYKVHKNEVKFILEQIKCTDYD
jgi:hypothetical protein